MTRTHSLMLALCCTVFAIACDPSQSQNSSSTNGFSSAELSEKIDTMCVASCDWALRCGKSTSQDTCLATCKGSGLGPAMYLRPAYFPAVSVCFSSLACTESTDDCYANVSLADPAYPEIPVVMSCFQKHEGCPGTFSDDLCETSALFVDGIREQIEICFAKPCAEVKDCMTSVIPVVTSIDD